LTPWQQKCPPTELPSEGDLDKGVDIATFLKAEEGRQNLKGIDVQGAEESVDPAQHPCDATDMLADDPLCTLLANARSTTEWSRAHGFNDLSDLDDAPSSESTIGRIQTAMVHTDETTGEPIVVPHPILHLDSPISTIQLSAGTSAKDSARYVTLSAAKADKEISQASASWDREYSQRAAALNRGVENELKHDEDIGRHEAALAWDTAEKVLHREMSVGVDAERRLPGIMRKRTAVITEAARQRKTQAERAAVHGEEQAMRDDDAHQNTNLKKLQRELEVTTVDQDIERREAQGEMRQIMDGMKAPGQTELQLHYQKAAAQKIKRQQDLMERALAYQDEQTRNRQDEQVRSLNIMQEGMLGEQRMVDRAIDHDPTVANAMGVGGATPAVWSP